MNDQKPVASPALPDTLIAVAAAVCITALGWWAFTLPLPSPDEGSGLAPRPLLPCVMDQEGYLRGKLYAGQSEIEINWQGKDLRCDGMFRPDGAGIRMVFDQYLDDDRPGLVFVMGVTDAVLNEPVDEASVNITLIDQVNGRFYSTGELSRCWTSFDEQLKLSGTSNETWRIDGIIFCQGPLNELRGDGRIQLSEMQYSGLFNPGFEN